MTEPAPALWPTAHQAILAGQSPAIPGPALEVEDASHGDDAQDCGAQRERPEGQDHEGPGHREVEVHAPDRTAANVHTKVVTYYGALSLRDRAVISLGSDRPTAESLLHDARDGNHPWRLVPPLLESTITTVETVSPWAETVMPPGGQRGGDPS